MVMMANSNQLNVHCRVGSLEIMMERSKQLIKVHCRVGSLEILMTLLNG